MSSKGRAQTCHMDRVRLGVPPTRLKPIAIQQNGHRLLLTSAQARARLNFLNLQLLSTSVTTEDIATIYRLLTFVKRQRRFVKRHFVQTIPRAPIFVKTMASLALKGGMKTAQT